MPAVTGGALPSLSQIMGWDTEHLTRASADWSATAEHWEEAFDSVHRGMLAPGGTVWEGEAADAAQERAFADLVEVRGKGFGLPLVLAKEQIAPGLHLHQVPQSVRLPDLSQL